MRLVIAVGVLLALPGTAMGAVTLTGPETIAETGGTATYTMTCEALDATAAIEVDPGPAPPATEGDDYEDASATVNCLLAQEHTFEVPVSDDPDDEENENFTVSATALLSSDTVETTILDNDPIASIAPAVFVTEGVNSTASVLVTLSTAPVSTTTIPYATKNLTATAGSDYTFTSGTLAFAAGETSKTISVPIADDSAVEGPEAFLIDLGNPNNGSLSATAKQGAVGIFSDDVPPQPAASIARTVTVEEGNRGTVNALFEVALSFVPTEEVRVSWKTLDWTATGADYDGARGTLVFQPGQRTKSVSVDVKGDRNDEPDEAFGVTLENPVGGTLAATKSGFGIITDDDGPKMGIGKPKARKRVLVTKLSCPEGATQCVGELVVKMGRKRVGKSAFDMAKGTETKLRVPMSRKARRKLSRRALRIRLIATAQDASGDERVTKRRARLKRRR